VWPGCDKVMDRLMGHQSSVLDSPLIHYSCNYAGVCVVSSGKRFQLAPWRRGRTLVFDRRAFDLAGPTADG